MIQILEKGLITFSDCLVYSKKCYPKKDLGDDLLKVFY